MSHADLPGRISESLRHLRADVMQAFTGRSIPDAKARIAALREEIDGMYAAGARDTVDGRPGRWVTLRNGQPVFLPDGGTLQEAIDKLGDTPKKSDGPKSGDGHRKKAEPEIEKFMTRAEGFAKDKASKNSMESLLKRYSREDAERIVISNHMKGGMSSQVVENIVNRLWPGSKTMTEAEKTERDEFITEMRDKYRKKYQDEHDRLTS